MAYNNDVEEKICFYCANSFVDDNNKLHCCTSQGKGKIVADDDTCEEWN